MDKERSKDIKRVGPEKRWQDFGFGNLRGWEGGAGGRIVGVRALEGMHWKDRRCGLRVDS